MDEHRARSPPFKRPFRVSRDRHASCFKGTFSPSSPRSNPLFSVFKRDTQPTVSLARTLRLDLGPVRCTAQETLRAHSIRLPPPRADVRILPVSRHSLAHRLQGLAHANDTLPRTARTSVSCPSLIRTRHSAGSIEDVRMASVASWARWWEVGSGK